MSILEIVLASYILISWLLVIISITFGNSDTFIGIVMMIICPPLILVFISQAIYYEIKTKQARKKELENDNTWNNFN